MPMLSQTCPRFRPHGFYAWLKLGVFRGIILSRIDLTGAAVAVAQFQAPTVELWASVMFGFLWVISRVGGMVLMCDSAKYIGGRCKPALGQFGELIVEQARIIAQAWLAEVRQGGDPGGAKA